MDGEQSFVWSPLYVLYDCGNRDILLNKDVRSLLNLDCSLLKLPANCAHCFSKTETFQNLSNRKVGIFQVKMEVIEGNSQRTLENQLEVAKNNLKDLNLEIRKINGRPLDLDRKRPGENKRFSDVGSPPSKRRLEPKRNFSNKHTAILPKPKVSSRVIKEQLSKEDIVAVQGADKARNQRIFKSLLGTLQKFCQEESKLQVKAEKKAEIEKKLDEKQRREKEVLRKEKQLLLNARRKQQINIRLIETKMMKLKNFENWKGSKLPLMNFIKTKASPHIYYLPKTLNQDTEERLRKSKKSIEIMIEKKQLEVSDEISRLETQLNESEQSESVKSNVNETLPDISFIEHQIEPIAFDSDPEINTDFFKKEQTSDPNSLEIHRTNIFIKTERCDEEMFSVL